MKTKKSEIKSARLLSTCPFIVSVVYVEGGSDTYTAQQLEKWFTNEAKKLVMEMIS